jgi:hypothetical protein
LRYDDRGPWRLDGDVVGAPRTFATLTDALDCARELTGSAETLIELQVNGFDACIHQETGWPRRIQAPERAAA